MNLYKALRLFTIVIIIRVKLLRADSIVKTRGQQFLTNAVASI